MTPDTLEILRSKQISRGTTRWSSCKKRKKAFIFFLRNCTFYNGEFITVTGHTIISEMDKIKNSSFFKDWFMSAAILIKKEAQKKKEKTMTFLPKGQNLESWQTTDMIIGKSLSLQGFRHKRPTTLFFSTFLYSLQHVEIKKSVIFMRFLHKNHNHLASHCALRLLTKALEFCSSIFAKKHKRGCKIATGFEATFLGEKFASASANALSTLSSF